MKFSLTSPRFIHGQYVDAGPGSPVVVELPDSTPPDVNLKPLKAGEQPEPEKLKKHYVEKTGSGRPNAANRQPKPTAGEPAPAGDETAAPVVAEEPKAGKRAADKSVI